MSSRCPAKISFLKKFFYFFFPNSIYSFPYFSICSGIKRKQLRITVKVPFCLHHPVFLVCRLIVKTIISNKKNSGFSETLIFRCFHCVHDRGRTSGLTSGASEFLSISANIYLMHALTHSIKFDADSPIRSAWVCPSPQTVSKSTSSTLS